MAAITAGEFAHKSVVYRAAVRGTRKGMPGRLRRQAVERHLWSGQPVVRPAEVGTPEQADGAALTWAFPTHTSSELIDDVVGIPRYDLKGARRHRP